MAEFSSHLILMLNFTVKLHQNAYVRCEKWVIWTANFVIRLRGFQKDVRWSILGFAVTVTFGLLLAHQI